MDPAGTRSLRRGFPLAVFIAILAFVILTSVILMSLRSILDRNDSDDALRAGYEPVVLPNLAEKGGLSGRGAEQDIVFQFDFGTSVLMAKNAMKAGNLVRAEDILRSLLLFFPNSPTVEKLLGNVFYLSGKYADAERIYRTVFDRDPSDPLYLNNLAMAQGMQGNYADAVANMKKVLEMDPESAMTDLNLAGLYSKSGNRALARKHFESARKKLHGDFRNLSFDPCLQEFLAEPERRGQIPPLPDRAETSEKDEKPEPAP